MKIIKKLLIASGLLLPVYVTATDNSTTIGLGSNSPLFDPTKPFFIPSTSMDLSDLEHNQNIELYGDFSTQEWFRAAQMGNLKKIKMLREHMSFTGATQNGQTALDLAAQHGHEDAVQLLIDLGVPSAQFEHLYSGGEKIELLFVAARYNFTNIFIKILAENNDLNLGRRIGVCDPQLTKSQQSAPIYFSKTLFNIAYEHGHTAIIDALLNYPTFNRLTALRTAKTRGEMELLIKHGALDDNHESYEAEQAQKLDLYDVFNHHICSTPSEGFNCLELLIKHCSQTTIDHVSPWLLCKTVTHPALTETEKSALIRMVLKYFHEQDKDKPEYAFLHEACQRVTLKPAIALLRAGAKVNGICEETHIGENVTPLMHAAHHEQSNMVKVLLVSGADPQIVSANGETAVHLTENTDIRRMLTDGLTTQEIQETVQKINDIRHELDLEAAREQTGGTPLLNFLRNREQGARNPFKTHRIYPAASGQIEEETKKKSDAEQTKAALVGISVPSSAGSSAGSAASSMDTRSDNQHGTKRKPDGDGSDEGDARGAKRARTGKEAKED